MSSQIAESWVRFSVIGGVGSLFWGTPDIAGYLKTAGFFQGSASIENDLLDAPADEEAAMRLGTSCSELSFPVRTTELTNWIENLKLNRWM